MALAFYISGHGFGHASRDVEVINALGADTDERIVIRSSVRPELLARTLRVPYDLLPGPCDTGIVQVSSIEQDDAATIGAARRFYASFDARVAAEARALQVLGIRLVVGDIPPLAFDVAHRLGVPSIALGNFTWDWIYEMHPGFQAEAGDLIDRLRTSYRRATRALELPFAGGFEIFDRVDRVPLVARRHTQPRDAVRAHFGLPDPGRVALLSFGGYGLPAIDLAALDCPDWTIVTTDPLPPGAASLPNVHRLAERDVLGETFRYEDLVAAVDVVITKPGYGIVSECIASGTGLLYTSRGQFREYGVIVAGMPRYLRCGFISHEALFAGHWRDPLEQVCAQPAPRERVPVDGAEQAAEIILEQIQQG